MNMSTNDRSGRETPTYSPDGPIVWDPSTWQWTPVK